MLRGGLVFDGTGAPPVVTDIGIHRGRLAIPGGEAADAVIDVTGLAVCPGFVDLHTHSDLTILSTPGAPSRIRQGVTTEVVGNCGLGVAPVAPPSAGGAAGGGSTNDPASGAQIRRAVSYLDLDPAVVVGWRDVAGYLEAVRRAAPVLNVATLTPHLPIHASVVGLGRQEATAAQIRDIVRIAEAGLVDGAVGLSTGLVYPPLCFASERELRALGEIAATYDRLFAWHVRDYTDHLLESVRQAIGVARDTGCRTQISHLTVVGRRNWGAVRGVLDEIDRARDDGLDIGVDAYPYLAGNAPLSQLLPDWVLDGGSDEFRSRLRDRGVRDAVVAAWEVSHFAWDDIVINAIVDDSSAGDRSLVGRTLTDIGRERDVPPAEAALDVLARHGTGVLMVAFGRSEDDLRTVLAHRATVIASDGQSIDPAGPTGASGMPHPRSFGCFPRYLGRYAGDLADGIRRCTSGPADRIGLADRGRIRPGCAADLIVFAPDQLMDTATFTDPQRFPTGIERVLVAGQTVVLGGRATGARPGQVLTAAR